MMMKIRILVCLMLMLLLGVDSYAKNISEVISRGNIVTTTYNPEAETGRYLGNGRLGAVFSALGMNLSPEQQQDSKLGASHFSHMNHWGRFRFISAIEKHETTADYILPMYKIYWEKTPTQVSNYRQEQNVYDGTLTTSFRIHEGTDIKVSSWFDMENRDLAAMRIYSSRGSQTLRLKTMTDYQAYSFVFRDNVTQATEIRKVGNQYCLTITCGQTLNHCSSQIYVYSSSPVKVCNDGLSFTIRKGNNDIFISYGKPVSKTDIAISHERTIAAWHDIWANTGWLDLPDDHAQQMWVRSMAYMLQSYSDTSLGMIQPTNGMSGNVYPFNYVQDMEYMAPSLMMLGHKDIIMKWVEHFANDMDNLRSYAKHLWPEAEGIYPPWELPFGSIEGYHEPNVPVAFCYEPHNNGYLCRMAKEAADFANDKAWAQKYAYPLIREICKFYKSACKRGADGLWHLSWSPCIGQDEAGGRNKSDYLCTLYSAQYSFTIAVELGLDDDGSLARILNDGLAFQSLISPRGTFHTAHGAELDFGKQKHPVQLDGLSYFPINPQPLLPELKAYSLRHDITEDARKPLFYGWTLGQLLLTGSNLKNTEGWLKDWSVMRSANYTDPDWVLIRESSGNTGASYYCPTHGMITQSIIRNYVNDFWGVLDIAGCPVFDDDISFGNIATRLGVTVSGTITAGQINLTLDAQRDVTLRVNGRDVTMKKGETKQMKL